MRLRWLHCSLHKILLLLSLLFSTVSSSSLTELSAQQYADALDKKTPLLVLISSDGCKDCQQAEEILDGMTKEGEITQLIPGTQVYKQKPAGPVPTASLGIKLFPSLVLMRGGTTAIYTDKFDSSDSVFFWLEKAGPTPMTQILTDDTFEHLTQAASGATTGHWAVLFYRKSCEEHLHVLESVGVSEKQWINVAKVDLDSSPKVGTRFKISNCPELIYFREGKMYRYETQKYDIPALTSFVKSWYRNVKGSSVPVEPSTFDELTEYIADYLKRELEGENRNFVIAVLVGMVAVFAITTIFCCMTGGSDSKQKKD